MLLRACLPVFLGSQAVELIDLTRLPPDPRMAGKSSGVCSKGGAGELPVVFPVNVVLVTLDRGEYRGGGRIVAEVQLDNRGSVTLTVPVGLEPFSRTAEQLSMVSVKIVGPDARGIPAILAGTVLKGVADLPGTTKTLQPGRGLRLRFASAIQVGEFLPAPREATRTLPVRAEVTMQKEPCVWATPIPSGNSLTVRLRR